jgi:hypothetical protein
VLLFGGWQGLQLTDDVARFDVGQGGAPEGEVF